MATSTIGSDGGDDYPTIALWNDDLPDPFTADEIGQLRNEEHLAPSGTEFCNFTQDTATYNLILEPQSGAGHKDHADKATNPLRYTTTGARLKSNGSNTSFGRLLSFKTDRWIVRGLIIQNGYSGSGGGAIRDDDTFGHNNNAIEECIIEVTGSGAIGVSFTGAASKIVNTVIIDDSTSGAKALRCRDGADVYNCTIARPSNRTSGGTGLERSYGTLIVKNTAIFGFNTTVSGSINSASDYNATDASAPTNWGSNSLASQTYADQFENNSSASSTHDFRLKSGSDLETAGTRDAGNTGDLDIIDQARDTSTPDIGCWEYQDSGTTGTGAGTLSAITASASGVIEITGTSSGTLSALTGSSSGTYTPQATTGTGAGDLAAVTGSASGLLEYSGSGAGTLASITAASSGVLIYDGTGAGDLSALTGSATGAFSSADFIGTGAGDLAAITGSASGVLEYVGTGNGSLAAITGASIGVIEITGTSAGDLSAITGVASGSFIALITGTGAGNLSSVTGSASGVFAGVITGTGVATLEAITGSAAGSNGGDDWLLQSDDSSAWSIQANNSTTWTIQ